MILKLGAFKFCILWVFICPNFSHRIAGLRLEIQQATDDLLGLGYVFPTDAGRTERIFHYYCISELNIFFIIIVFELNVFFIIIVFFRL